MNGTLVKKLGEYFLYIPYDSIYGPERTSASRFFKVTMSTDTENVLVATTSEEDEYIELAKLSMENCDEVASGYNLDELAEEIETNFDIKTRYDINSMLSEKIGFRAGFKKRDEMLSDKKFTLDDIKKAFNRGYLMKFNPSDNYQETWDILIQSLQQNEWDVEIEWEDEIGGKPTPFQKRTIIRELDNGEEIEWTCFWDNGWWGTDGVRCPNVISWERMPILDRKNRLILNRLEQNGSI